MDYKYSYSEILSLITQCKKEGLITDEEMLNITHYQRNANQNYNEVPSHTGQNDCYPKVYKQ